LNPNKKQKSHRKRYSLNLEGKRLRLKPIQVSDASKEYVNWLNSKEINQFLESRFKRHNIQNLKNYIKKVKKDKNTYFFVILVKENGKHIGNIKLGPIDWNHKFGEIGIMIGDKNSWGKEYAKEAICIISDFAFKKLKLHKLTAGSYENNKRSISTFLKAGFFKEGCRISQFLYEKRYVGSVQLAKLNQ